MAIENELKALRYLINDLILRVYDISVRQDDISPKKRAYVMGEPNANGSSLGYDLFSLPKDKYQSLIDRYGVDVVNDACVRLDEFIKINEYIPFGKPYFALTRKFVKEVLAIRNKEKSNEQKTDG
jgi:hypothetical protein